jgi:signal transduction histidine kinase
VLSQRLSRVQLITLDALASAGYTAVLVGLTVGLSPHHARVPMWAGCLIVAGTGVPAAARRLWPVPVFCVVLAVSLVSLAAGTARDPFIAAGFALYLVALTSRGRPEVPLARMSLIAAVGLLLAVVLGGAAPAGSAQGLAGNIGLLVSGAAVMYGAWTLGRAIRERRTYAARAAAQLAEQAVATERLRIARELHDVVAHSMGVIAVKAGVANYLLRSRPEEAGDALRVIETASRSGLADLRRMLGVLRSEDGSGEESADLAPAPGLDGLPALARQAALAGVQVDLDVRRTADLPEAVSLSAYRIVQEALTNVIRHAAPASCRVLVAANEKEVTIDVSDDGPGTRVLPRLPGSDGQAAGHGLIGMRERAELHGGSFEAGPRAEGGFKVSAKLRFEAISRAAPPTPPTPAPRAAPPKSDIS